MKSEPSRNSRDNPRQACDIRNLSGNLNAPLKFVYLFADLDLTLEVLGKPCCLGPGKSPYDLVDQRRDLWLALNGLPETDARLEVLVIFAEALIARPAGRHRD